MTFDRDLFDRVAATYDEKPSFFQRLAVDTCGARSSRRVLT